MNMAFNRIGRLWNCMIILVVSFSAADVFGISTVGEDKAAGITNAAGMPIAINYFYEPGCLECMEVSEKVMPRLQERFGGSYRVIDRDIGIMSNYLELVRFQESLGVTRNESVYMVVDGRYMFNGLDEINKGLFERIAAIVGQRPVGAAVRPRPPAVGIPKPANDTDLLSRRLERFTFPAVMAAGFIDGINPCAISTLVFFMSVLSVSKVRDRQLLVIGSWYCFASFLTYALIGFGLMNALHRLSAFRMARVGIEGGMVVLLAIFAFFSFRDAWRYRVTGDSKSVVLQIPHGIKAKMHDLMRALPGTRYLAVAAFGLGAAVTVLESVCTGQVYVPTLVLVIKSGYSPSKGLAYLLLYNAMFVLPLVAVFVVVYRGLQFRNLLNWSRRNVVASKILLGCLFVVLAWLIIIL